MSVIYIIEDEPIMAECIALAAESVTQMSPDGTLVRPTVETFSDAVLAMQAFQNAVPDLILLDIMLTGPNGFTFLQEIMSYPDTARIPVILITSLTFSMQDLAPYGIVQVLDKATMTPLQIQAAIRAVLPLAAGQRDAQSQEQPDVPPQERPDAQ